MRLRHFPLVLLALSIGLATPTLAAAADQPISGHSLVLKRAANGLEKLTFASKDPATLFPAIGGPDDPTTNGATIELFSPDFPTVTFTVPSGAGVPGWTSKVATYSSYNYIDKFAGDGTPVSKVQLKQSKILKLTSKSVGFPLNGPTGPIGIRVTIGSLRSCALFIAATIKKDQANSFRAGAAVAPADCADATLGAYDPGACENGSFGSGCGGNCPPGAVCGTQDLSSCVCISETQPCGTTAPVCNGECPVGEECLPIGGYPLPNCGCLPAGSTACGDGQCSGDCPVGQECNHIYFPTYDSCHCGPPGSCGTGGDDCPPGYSCGVYPGGAICFP